jgi:hypothetical protein
MSLGHSVARVAHALSVPCRHSAGTGELRSPPQAKAYATKPCKKPGRASRQAAYEAAAGLWPFGASVLGGAGFIPRGALAPRLGGLRGRRRLRAEAASLPHQMAKLHRRAKLAGNPAFSRPRLNWPPSSRAQSTGIWKTKWHCRGLRPRDLRGAGLKPRAGLNPAPQRRAQVARFATCYHCASWTPSKSRMLQKPSAR